jgi:hypothetical protein
MRSALPLAVFFVLLPLQNWACFRWSRSLWTNSHGPGADPPWYFIGNDVVEGLVAGAILAILLAVAFACARAPAYSRFARMVSWQGVLWNAHKVLWGIVIWRNTSNLWDMERATTSWSTFSSYLHDPLREWVFGAGVVLALPLVWADARHARMATAARGGQQEASVPRATG